MYYHSIDDEVPGPNQRMVRLGYAAWILVATGYCLNFLVLSVAFFGKGGSTTVATWFFALLVSAAGLPGSWTFWYQALYRAAQTPAGLVAYARFFIHMSFHILFCLWMVLSLPKVGDWSAGVFRMIGWFAAGSPKGTALGFLSIANIAVWGSVRCLSRACGSSAPAFALFPAEACRGARRMRRVMFVATDAGIAAVRLAFSGGASAGWKQVPHRRRLCRNAAPKARGAGGSQHRGARLKRRRQPAASEGTGDTTRRRAYDVA